MLHSAGITSDNLQAVLDLTISAVREAGDLLRQEFFREGGPRANGASAPIDTEVELFLKHRLLAALACGWVGEETNLVPSQDRVSWVIDPHDGTSAFLEGLRGSSVSVALLQHGVPVLGVVYAFAHPNHGDLIAWAEGCGPVRRNGVAVNVDLGDKQLDSHQIVALSHVAADVPEANAALVYPARFIAMPSIAYRLALAAVGDVVAAVAINGVQSWDFAAGHALLRGSGGILVDQHGHEVRYDLNGRAFIERCFGGAPAAIQALVVRDWGKALAASAMARPRPSKRLVSDTDMLSRAQACLLGQIAGDSLGALVEFHSREDIAAAYPNGLMRLADGGPWNIIAGQCTDDSEMALALARTLVRDGRYDLASVFEAYRDWFLSEPFDIGATTRAALINAKLLQGGLKDSQANGSLMRVSPIGIFAAGNPARAADLAAADSALTHPPPVCLSACRSYAAAIAVGVATGDRSQMLEAAHAHAGLGEGGDIVRHRLKLAMTEPPTNYQHQMGWVLTAYQNAFHHLAMDHTLASGVIDTVAQGGDTDTNGAIVGALLGSADGYEAMPRQWLQTITSCRPLMSNCARQPRPSRFWPSDAMKLAEQLLSQGHDCGI